VGERLHIIQECWAKTIIHSNYDSKVPRIVRIRIGLIIIIAMLSIILIQRFVPAAEGATPAWYARGREHLH